MNKGLFAVSYGGGHISMVLPVLDAVERNLGVSCDLMALTTGYARASQLRPARSYRDFLHLVDARAALDWGQKLLDGNRHPDVPLDETIAYLGINYLDLIDTLGLDGAKQRYHEKGRYGFHPARFMQKVLDYINPHIVLTTNSPRSEQAVIEAAVALGIPSVGMIDLLAQTGDSYVTRAVRASKTCCLAQPVKEHLIAAGFSKDEVYVTGNPAFDELFLETAEAAAEAFLRDKGWAGQKVILYAGTWEPVPHKNTDIPAGRSYPIELEKILRDYVRDRGDVRLIVRYHPSDWHLYPRGADDQSVHFSVPTSESISTLIKASTVVVNTNSTVGLQAAVAHKPVVSLENSPSVHEWFSWAALGVSYGCDNQHRLSDVLDEILANPKPKLRYAGSGGAAQRVAAVIGDLIQPAGARYAK
jgi:hypothetical protein